MKANIATAIIVLLLASSLHNLGSQEVDNLTQEVNLVAKNTNSHEVRVHHIGDSWNDSQQIDWYPLQTDFYRTIQFTIRVDSVANPGDIVSSELTMVWSGNVSSQDATFSVDLISDDFDLVDGIPEAIVNFQYQTNTDIGDYEITLSTITTNGALQDFEHAGITIQQYGVFIENSVADYGILFSQDTTTEVEFIYTNVGFELLEIDCQVITNLPSSWSITTDQNTLFNIFPSENYSLTWEITAPNDAIYTDLSEKFEFEVSVSYDDGEQFVELSQISLDFPNQLVPYESQTILSTFSDAEMQMPISFSDQEVYDNPNYQQEMLFAINNRTATAYMEIHNIGAQASDLSLTFAISGNANDIQYSLFDSFNQELDEKEGAFDLASFQPLEKRLLRVDLALSSDTVEQFKEIYITVSNNNWNSITTIGLFVANSDFSNLLDCDISSVELMQNESAMANIAMSYNPIGTFDLFDDRWTLTSTIDYDEEIQNPINISSNSQFYNSFFSLETDKQAMFDITTDQTTDGGNYTVTFSLSHSPLIGTSDIMITKQILVEVIAVPDDNNQTDGENNTGSNNNTGENNNTDNNTDNNTSQPNNNNSGNNSDNNTSNPNDNNTNNQTNQQVDSDNDGIIDSADDCPNTIPNAVVDDKGCVISTENEQGDNSDSETTATSTDDYNSLIIPIIAVVCIVGVVLIILKKKNGNQAPSQKESAEITLPPIMPAPINLEPVVLRQWTDEKGYSWRQMSDQTILWWNGSEWINYGKN